MKCLTSKLLTKKLKILNHKRDIVFQSLKSKAKNITDYFDLVYGDYLLKHLYDHDNLEIPKIALVKQDVYQDLYCCYNSDPIDKIIFSSLKRSGPVALFTKLKTDFFIVNTESDPECMIWKEKSMDCNSKDLDFYESLKTEPFLDGIRGHKYGQSHFSINCDNVEWNKYDIVISLDITIPKRITKRYPDVVWSYYISEPCMSSWKRSKYKPIDGYDLFLNQGFRYFKILPSLSIHEVEFPYFFQHSGCFESLITNNDIDKCEGIFLESHTGFDISEYRIKELETFGTVRTISPKIENIINDLLKSKYFIRIGGRKLWGNPMVEAISAGCLVLGSPGEFNNKSLFTKDTVVNSFDQLIDKLRLYEENDALYINELNKQQALVDYLCFYRPLNDLLIKSKQVITNRVALIS